MAKELPSAIAATLLRAALIAVDDQLGAGASKASPALVGAIAQATATQALADAITGIDQQLGGIGLNLNYTFSCMAGQVEAFADALRTTQSTCTTASLRG